MDELTKKAISRSYDALVDATMGTLDNLRSVVHHAMVLTGDAYGVVSEEYKEMEEVFGKLTLDTTYRDFLNSIKSHVEGFLGE